MFKGKTKIQHSVKSLNHTTITVMTAFRIKTPAAIHNCLYDRCLVG